MSALQYVLSPSGLPLTQILFHGNSIVFMCLGEQTITVHLKMDYQDHGWEWMGGGGGGVVFWHRQSNRKYKVCSVTASSRTTSHHV